MRRIVREIGRNETRERRSSTGRSAAVVFGAAGGLAVLMMGGLALALSRIDLEFGPLFGDIEFGTAYTGPTVPPQPSATCAALAEVRDAAANAYRAQTKATQGAQRPVPQELSDALARLDNALSFAIPMVPPLLQPHLQEARDNVQVGRMAAASAVHTAAYSRDSTGPFFNGGFALARASERLADACRFSLMP